MIDLAQDFQKALAERSFRPVDRRLTLAVPQAAEPSMSALVTDGMNHFPGLDVTLVSLPWEQATAPQIVKALCFLDLGEELLLLEKHVSQPLALDWITEQLETPTTLLPWKGSALLSALLADGWNHSPDN